MATTVGSHSVAAFTSPNNGDPLDATVVKGNDNTIRVAYVNHDGDPGIHLQSSTLASRPAAGTAGRKWMTTDTGAVKLWYDDGSNWQEINYLSTVGTITLPNELIVNGNTTLNGNATMNGAVTSIGNATSDELIVTARVASSLIPKITNTNDLGTGSLRFKDFYLAGDASIAGTVVGGTFNGSGASLTNIPVSALTAGTFGTGNYTFPDNVTIQNFVRAGRQTFTNVNGAVSVDVSAFNHTRLTLNGNATISLTGGVTGGVYTIEVLQDGSGGRTTAWGSGIVWSNGSVPGGTTTAARKDIYTFFYDSSNYIGTLFATNVASTG